MSQAPDPLRYRTLLRRVVASLVDALVLAPLILAERLLSFRLLDPVGQTISGGIVELAFIAYFVVLHARNGQTFGKRLTGVRVVHAHDETPFGWAAAIRRERPWLVLATLFILYDVAWFTVSESNFADTVLTYTYNALTTLNYTWLVADLGCTLVNSKHRALHDYIGGTVVVRTP